MPQPQTSNGRQTMEQMKTFNSLSGGQSSSYIAANYPADFDDCDSGHCGL